MKEYLLKLSDGSYSYSSGDTSLIREYVERFEIPEGATMLLYCESNNGFYHFANSENKLMATYAMKNGNASWYGNAESYIQFGAEVVWRREQEIKMKEYLSKVNGKYELIKVIEVEEKESHAKGWIEVPEGADYLTLHTSKSGYFWTEDGKYIGWGGANDIHPEWKQYEMGEGVHHYADERNIKIVWRREKTVEYLDPSDWSLKVVGENSKISGDWILIPEGADFYAKDKMFGEICFYFYKDNSLDASYGCVFIDNKWQRCQFNKEKQTILWQRHTQPEELPFIDDEPVTIKFKNGLPVRSNGPYDMETKSSFNGDDIKYMDGCSFGKTESISDDPVNHPSHYVTHPSGIECIEITRHHDFAIGNAIKYLWRAGLKDSDNEVQDLKKAIWYIQDKINQLEKSNVSHNQGS